MLYYRVKPQYDNKSRYRKNTRARDSIYIANELYTEKELEKFNHTPAFFDKIEIPKTKIYWFFGARFAMEDKKQ